MTEPDWQIAKVVRVKQACVDIYSVVVRPTTWVKHVAGQHYQLHFSDQEFGRCYSVASSPQDEGVLEFGVQLIPSGLLSPRLCAVVPGDVVKIKGPLGEDFVWEEHMSEPVVLVGAGSGITPLLSIYIHYTRDHPNGPVKFIVSARTEN